jgi:CRISPR system Cascade subunit CasA
LTWQSRRVLLFEDDGAVTGVLASYGDVFDKESMFIEQMSGWHRSSDKSGKDIFIPNTLSKDRSMWRDLNALLPLSVPGSDNNRIPGIVRWRGFLKTNNAIDVDAVNISAIGAEYGAMMGVVNEVITDHISFNANLLTDLGKDWIPQILDVLEKTDKCIYSLGQLARDLAKSSGADDKDKVLLDAVSRAARTDAYFTFDAYFRKWLGSIEPETHDRYEVCKIWNEAMRTKILSLGRAMVDDADSSAFVGRGKKTNALTAHLIFKGSVYKVVPMESKKGGHDD